MHRKSLLACLVVLTVPTLTARGQAVIEATSGLASPDHLVDFGASLYPNWTTINTQFTGVSFTKTAFFTTGSFNNLNGGFLTNEWAVSGTTFTITFAAPVKDATFVYQ